MKALVIGGTSGQVARELAALDGSAFRIIVRGRPLADLSNPPSLLTTLADVQPDVVILTGAYTAVDLAETEQAAARAINAKGPAAISAYCAASDVPIVHLSTDYVFDGDKTDPYVETDPTNPRTIYGASKLEGEMAIASSGARHAIVRVSWVHAPHGKNFVRTMLRLSKSRDCLDVVADQIGRPTYAPHLAIAIRDIAARLALDRTAPTGVFHLTGSGQPCSWQRFAECIFEAARFRGGPHALVNAIPSSEYPTPAKRPSNSTLNCRRVREEYGIVLPNWESGVQECVDAIRNSAWQVE